MGFIFSFFAQLIVAMSFQEISSALARSIENARHCAIRLNFTKHGECERNVSHMPLYELNFAVKCKIKCGELFCEQMDRGSYFGSAL